MGFLQQKRYGICHRDVCESCCRGKANAKQNFQSWCLYHLGASALLIQYLVLVIAETYTRCPKSILIFRNQYWFQNDSLLFVQNPIWKPILDLERKVRNHSENQYWMSHTCFCNHVFSEICVSFPWNVLMSDFSRKGS